MLSGDFLRGVDQRLHGERGDGKDFFGGDLGVREGALDQAPDHGAGFLFEGGVLRGGVDGLGHCDFVGQRNGWVVG